MKESNKVSNVMLAALKEMAGTNSMNLHFRIGGFHCLLSNDNTATCLTCLLQWNVVYLTDCKLQGFHSIIYVHQ
jgi:hypothetical protein